MRTQDLTPERRDFVRYLVESGIPQEAAKRAKIALNETMQNVAVQGLLRDSLRQRLLQVAPVALRVLESLATDEMVPPAVRRLAASDLLDRAGLSGEAAQAVPVESLSDMPARDLRALVARLEGELFARAKPVRDLELVAVRAPSVLD